MLEKRPEDLETATTRLRTAAAQAALLSKRHKMKTDKKSVAKAPEKALLLAEAMAMEGHALMLLALIQVAANSYVKGAYYVRKSWKLWEATQKLMDELNATKTEIPMRLRGFVAFGLGFFFFGISLVPENLSFLVKLLGFQGDRQRAAELLTLSKDVPDCGKSIESALMLYSLRFWFSDERDNAAPLLAELRAVLPNSPLLFLISGFQAMITDHDSAKAVECYRMGGELVQVPQLKVVFLTSLAWAHFVREEWDPVRDLLGAHLASAKPGENHSYSSLNMATACYMLNKNAECAEWMKKVIEYEQKSNNWDNYAASVARAYLANNEFDRCSLLFLLSENAIECGYSDRALGYLKEIDGLDKWVGMAMDDKAAMAAYFRGCALRLQKKTDEAKSALIKAAGFHQKNLAIEARRAVPYSLVVLGEISMHDLNQLDAAARFFSKAKQYDKKYIFADTLQFRLKSDEEILADKRRKAERAETGGK